VRCAVLSAKNFASNEHCPLEKPFANRYPPFVTCRSPFAISHRQLPIAAVLARQEPRPPKFSPTKVINYGLEFVALFAFAAPLTSMPLALVSG